MTHSVRRSNPHGQSLLEVIIAVAVIGVGLGAALISLLNSNIQNRRTEFRTIATNLAREGLEVLRNQRDSNWLADEAFDARLVDASDPYNIDGTFLTTVTSVNPQSQTIKLQWGLDFAYNAVSPFDPPNPALAINVMDASGDGQSDLFVQSPTPPPGSTGTAFARMFTVQAICRTDVLNQITETIADATTCAAVPTATKVGVDAVVHVQYRDRGGDKVVTVEERLYDWRL